MVHHHLTILPSKFSAHGPLTWTSTTARTYARFHCRQVSQSTTSVSVAPNQRSVMGSNHPLPPQGSSLSAPGLSSPTLTHTESNENENADAEMLWTGSTSDWPNKSAPAFNSTSDGYSSTDEGPRRKKARKANQRPVKANPAAGSSTSPATNDSNENVPPSFSSDSDYDVTKPDTDFNFDEQLFNNMFASADTIAYEYEPGSPRPIVVDGSNIAFAHGNNKHFSEQGILICIDYFQQRGHDVKVFVSRCQHGEFTRQIAKDLESRRLLVFTPSRMVNGKRITAYDDRFILQYATVKKAIVVSNDNYRDLYDEDVKFHEVIRERLLQFSWPEEDVLMFPTDPLGRNGARLDEFLKFPGVANKTDKEKAATSDTAETKPGTSQGARLEIEGVNGGAKNTTKPEPKGEGEAEESSGYETSGSADAADAEAYDSGSDYDSDGDL